MSSRTAPPAAHKDNVEINWAGIGHGASLLWPGLRDRVILSAIVKRFVMVVLLVGLLCRAGNSGLA